MVPGLSRKRSVEPVSRGQRTSHTIVGTARATCSGIADTGPLRLTRSRRERVVALRDSYETVFRQLLSDGAEAGTHRGLALGAVDAPPLRSLPGMAA